MKGFAVPETKKSEPSSQPPTQEGKEVKEVKEKEKAPPTSSKKGELPGSYSLPIWSAQTVKHEWNFDVLKNGGIISSVSLHHRGYLTVGRLPTCDLSLEHPSISRQHAVIQHKSDGQIFLYDLKSTHGCFVNKVRVQPNTFHRLVGGDTVKFGASSRIYALNGGPDRDEEEARAWAAQVEAEEKEKERKRIEEERDAEGQTLFVGNLSERKKFLAEMKEKKGKPLKVKKGKWAELREVTKAKKRAERKAMKEAGLLSSSEEEDLDAKETKESKKRIEAFYAEDAASDDDSFYDRTTNVESQPPKKEVVTFESTQAQLSEIALDIEHREKEIEKIEKGKAEHSDSSDSLDSYLEQLNQKEDQNRVKVLKSEIISLQKDEKELSAIADTLKPAMDQISLDDSAWKFPPSSAPTETSSSSSAPSSPQKEPSSSPTEDTESEEKTNKQSKEDHVEAEVEMEEKDKPSSPQGFLSREEIRSKTSSKTPLPQTLSGRPVYASGLNKRKREPRADKVDSSEKVVTEKKKEEKKKIEKRRKLLKYDDEVEDGMAYVDWVPPSNRQATHL